VPPEYDRRLVAIVASNLNGRKLSNEEIRNLRNQFVCAVKLRNSNETV
jgi:hypothetical protein